jgi:hypothetical protein
MDKSPSGRLTPKEPPPAFFSQGPNSGAMSFRNSRCSQILFRPRHGIIVHLAIEEKRVSSRIAFEQGKLK